MHYWWVNQGQTHEIEKNGSFIWAPKNEIHGGFNRGFYNVSLVQPGDLVLCNVRGHIVAIGTVQTPSFNCVKPSIFPSEQNANNNQGYMAYVSYKSVKPFKHINFRDKLLEVIGETESPFDRNGKAKMKAYLSSLNEPLFDKILNLMNIDKGDFPLLKSSELEEKIDLEIESQIKNNLDIGETEKLALVLSRRGQGLFKENVKKIEKSCRVSGISNLNFLIASHIKPWRESTNEERLDGENGFLLSPNIDKLFDQYYISFSESGDLLFSSSLSDHDKSLFGLSEKNVGSFTAGQKKYLCCHRSKLKK